MSSHEPPVPDANQSPYPVQEPPHDHAPKTPVAAADDDDEDESWDDYVPDRGTLIGVAAAVGLVALAVGGWLIGRDRPDKPERAKPRRRKSSGSRKGASAKK